MIPHSSSRRKATVTRQACFQSFLLLYLFGQRLIGVAQSASEHHYEPTLASLDAHPLPQWYDDAKVGVMVTWGLFSVPGWAPVQNTDHNFSSHSYFKNNPYAEWYYNSMRVPGSPTSQYHREHYGESYDYYEFAEAFEKTSLQWNPDGMAQAFKDAGIRYVVLITKFHDGYSLWPTQVKNPNQPHLSSSRDLVGALTESVRNAGMKMGLYYSGGYDWTFDRGPIDDPVDYEPVKPETTAYGSYAFDQIHELINRYHPSILWNDIDWPRTGEPLQVIADYYNAVPDGVVDDRYGVKHSDFTSPEYVRLNETTAKKWEAVRGLGQSFGFNRAEGESETISSKQLIALLTDVVSKNGNLLLGVGPDASGAITPIQLDRLKSLGNWLRQNGESIYGTHPWVRSNDKTDDGVDVRFTSKGNFLYAILLSEPKNSKITLHSVAIAERSRVSLLGDQTALLWTQKGSDLIIEMPKSLPGEYAYVLQLQLR